MSIIKELKAEISRIARKEIRKELEPIKRVNASQRKYIADLRRELSDLDKEVKRLQKLLDIPAPEQPAEEDADQRFWITGKGVLSLRKRLGVTQIEFAELAGVTQQTIVRWEKTEGKIPLRGETVQNRLQELRSMGKKEAVQQLETE
ncbi:MAG: helix-turn-helix transcriptional regulator [Pontiellaceae bacterium]|nr:helix-turn-helix transcriptional regulator [Pontiellaceae bacterium]MBN2784184.1 helix-turn-helix transcriptional regulator [Pontiellaceae bacterium]